MSKNIIIQEGGNNCQFTAKKLKIDKVGGGTVLWVPEDETILKKKNITEEGTYKASDEGVYGYSEVTVDLTGTTQTKRITQNGTYKAEDEGLIGYSKVMVSVRGGNGSANSSGLPETSFDSNGNIIIGPGGSGSSVVGTDPNTGEWVTVGVDSGGNLVTTPVPAGIDIITPPSKTAYTEGETMDYSGIVVGLKTKSGGTFTNATYPNGHIPTQELVFPVATAHAEEGGGGATPPSEWDFTNIVTPVPYSNNTIGWWVSTAKSFEIYANCFLAVANTGGAGVFILFASSSEQISFYGYVVSRYNGEKNDINSSVNGTPFTYGGKTVYYAYISGDWGANDNTTPQLFSHVGSNNWRVGVEKIAWTIIYGSGGGSSMASIPVKWRSIYSGDTFEDSFEITVSGYTSSSGYSDDSSGSSSGGGGGF